MKRARLQGAAAVAQAFRSQATADVEVQSVGCLGQCGNGPMVVVLPEKIWYAQVTVGDVPKIVEQHLQGGKPVREKLYSKFHPHKQSRYIWLMAVGLVLALLGLLLWLIASQTYYFAYKETRRSLSHQLIIKTDLDEKNERQTNVNERQLTDRLKNFLTQKLTDKIKTFSKLMYHLLRIKRESDKLVIEVNKASLTEITGLSTFN